MSLKEPQNPTVSLDQTNGWQLTSPGDKCGSAYIDTAFKIWLRDVLGPENYAKLDPLNAHGRISAHTMESGPIRDLVRKFIAKKETFSELVEDIHLELPPPLDRLDKEGRVRQGELTISG